MPDAVIKFQQYRPVGSARFLPYEPAHEIVAISILRKLIL